MLLKLTKPIQLGKEGSPVSELNFREEIVAGDLRGLKASAMADPQMDDFILIAARLTAQPPALLNQLCMADFGEVVTAVSGFLNAGQETGTTP
jgi:hypothetical protein